jgi:hypothetical protein
MFIRRAAHTSHRVQNAQFCVGVVKQGDGQFMNSYNRKMALYAGECCPFDVEA